jgi:outer membrane protein W
MKRLYLFLVLFFFVVGFSAISWAEGFLPLDGSIGFGARLYGVFPKNDSFQPPGEPRQKLDFHNEAGGEVNGTYRFLEYFALEGGVGYTQFNMKNKTLGVKWATIEAIPIFATLQFRWISRKPEELKWIVPYAAIGGGYYFLEIEERDALRSVLLPLVGIDLEIDDTFFFHVGGGFDIFLTRQLALNFEGRYAWAKTDIDETQTDAFGNSRTLGDTINLNAAFIGTGFKFYF